ncbi:MAG: PH domain-containing protein [Acidimicrobiales bacterium]|nr:PH domain-containing protein [Acidimicrobiales bacterium]
MAEPQRQSPVAVVFLLIKAIRNLGIVNIGIGALFLFNLRSSVAFAIVAPLLVLAALAVNVLAWWRYTFVVIDDELVVTKGILSEQRLVIPLGRVQSVSIEQDFLHRPLELVRASLDTAGSSDTEFEIQAVTRPLAEALQRLTAEYVGAVTAPPGEPGEPGQPAPLAAPVERVLLRRTPTDLVKVGLAQSPWAGLALIGPLLIFVDDFAGVFGFDLGEQTAAAEDFEAGLWVIWAVVGFLALATVFSLVLQVSRAVVTDWDLTLFRTPTGLRRTSGLLAKKSRASSVERIQRLEHRQTPVQRLVGINHLNLVTIGEGDIALPGSTEGDIAGIRDVVLEPDSQATELDRRISPKAVIPPIRNGMIVLLLAMVGLYFSPIGWWSLLGLLVVPVIWYLAQREIRLHRWSVNGAGLAQRHEVFTIRTEEIALRRAQRVDVRQSFFQRRRNLASVTIDMADGSVQIPMIPLGEAKALRDLGLACAETDPRPWM